MSEPFENLRQKLLKRRNIQQFVGSNFRRSVYPRDVSLCNKSQCNAGEGCCHSYLLEKINFCVRYGPDQLGGGGSEDYILERRIGKKWVEIANKPTYPPEVGKKYIIDTPDGNSAFFPTNVYKIFRVNQQTGCFSIKTKRAVSTAHCKDYIFIPI